MILYHGSNMSVEYPKILSSDRKLDFGSGFYLTSNYEQAARWAELTVLRRHSGEKTISVFYYDEMHAKGLKLLKFPQADEEWLRYTANNRKKDNFSDDYDIVIGPVANDRTLPVITAYFAGIYTETETIRRLLPQKLKDQYAFKTEKALTTLHLKEIIRL